MSTKPMDRATREAARRACEISQDESCVEYFWMEDSPEFNYWCFGCRSAIEPVISYRVRTGDAKEKKDS